MLLKKEIRILINKPRAFEYINVNYINIGNNKEYGRYYNYSNNKDKINIKMHYKINSKWHGKIIYIDSDGDKIVRYYVNMMNEGLNKRMNNHAMEYRLNTLILSL